MELARKFKIIVNSKECGTCSGPTPSAVAKKVVKKLCGTSSKAVRFSLKECKRGCERECGPYQGRMEKLDKHYKRDGKTITHRVVCGKVRKMRGGREFDEIITRAIRNIPSNLKHDFYSDDFEFRKESSDTDLKYKIINGTIYLFLGTVTIDGNNYYRYIITKNIKGEQPSRRMVPISSSQYINVNEIEEKKNSYRGMVELLKYLKTDFDETINRIPLEQRKVIAKCIYINNTGQTTMAPFMRSILRVGYNNSFDTIIRQQWNNKRKQQQQQQHNTTTDNK